MVRRFVIQAVFFLLGACFLSSCHHHSLHFPDRPFVVFFYSTNTSEETIAGMKEKMTAINPKIKYQEIKLEEPPVNSGQAAYFFDQKTRHHPSSTLFIVASEPSDSGKKPLLVQTGSGKFYIGPDNGIFTLAIQREKLERIWTFDKVSSKDDSPLSGNDLLAVAAARLVSGERTIDLGTPIKRSEMEFLSFPAPSTFGSIINGEIWSIDRFGNIITNISSELAPQLQTGSLMRITLGGKTVRGPLVKTVQEIPRGRVGLIFEDQNLLEIVISHDSAAKELGAKVGMPVTIQ